MPSRARDKSEQTELRSPMLSRAAGTGTGPGTSTSGDSSGEEEHAFLAKDESFVSSKAAPGDPYQYGRRRSRNQRSRSSKRNATPWIISTIILSNALAVSLSYNVFSLVRQSTSVSLSTCQNFVHDLGVNGTSPVISDTINEPKHATDNYHIGPALLSDLPDSRRAIKYTQQRYTGGLTYDNKTKTIIRIDDAPVKYFGPPSFKLDELWETTLLRNEFPILNDSEALLLPDLSESDRLATDFYFHFEPDYSHNLHCLNAIRQHLTPVLYPNITLSAEQLQKQKEDHDRDVRLAGPDWTVIHIEHCMDRIRQSIMCAGDMTPSPLHAWKGYAIALGQTGERTCRDWDSLRQWVDERWQAGEKMKKELGNGLEAKAKAESHHRAKRQQS